MPKRREEPRKGRWWLAAVLASQVCGAATSCDLEGRCPAANPLALGDALRARGDKQGAAASYRRAALIWKSLFFMVSTKTKSIN